MGGVGGGVCVEGGGWVMKEERTINKGLRDIG